MLLRPLLTELHEAGIRLHVPNTWRRIPPWLWRRASLVRYVSTSVVATVVDYSMYLVLAAYMAPPVANLLSQTTAMGVNFTFHRLVVFRGTRRSVLPSLVLSLSLSGVGVLLGSGIIWLIRQGLPEHVLLPKLLATGCVFFWNFLSKKYIAFPVPKAAGETTAETRAGDGV